MIRHCPRCNTTQPVDQFDGVFCMGCRLPVGTVGKWSSGANGHIVIETTVGKWSSGANGYIVIDGGWTYPAEAPEDLPEDLPVRVEKFLSHRRYRLVPVGS
jgi:hypothetical protein